MPEAVTPLPSPVSSRWIRWAGIVLLVGSLAFIGERLWQMDWSSLATHATWTFAAATAGACILFGAADHAFANAWSTTADPQRRTPGPTMARIYGQGVLMKYLPGSVFQYVGRQIGGAREGIAAGQLVKSSAIEIGLHVIASAGVAAVCFLVWQGATVAALGGAVLVGVFLLSRHPIVRALGWQIAGFGGFAIAAVLVGAAVLPVDADVIQFAGIFLLAWLAGFVVPVAPGGLGVREAALIALAGGSMPMASVLAATLALRIASVIGDLGYGLASWTAGRK